VQNPEPEHEIVFTDNDNNDWSQIFLTSSSQFPTGLKLMMTTTKNHLTLLKHYLVLLGEVEALTNAYSMAS
jgi:hypothetical protein